MSTKSEQTRRRLLAGAMASFAEHGFHGTSTRHIAAAAGMSPAAVYVHYASKEELLYEITVAGHREILDLVTAAATADDTPTRRLAALVHDFVAYHARHHASARVVNYEMMRLSPAHLDEVMSIRAGIDEAIAGVVADGVRTGEFDAPNVRLTTTAVSSLAIDTSRWFRSDRPWTPDDVGDYYADLVLRMVAGD